MTSQKPNIKRNDIKRNHTNDFEWQENLDHLPKRSEIHRQEQHVNAIIGSLTTLIILLLSYILFKNI